MQPSEPRRPDLIAHWMCSCCSRLFLADTNVQVQRLLRLQGAIFRKVTIRHMLRPRYHLPKEKQLALFRLCSYGTGEQGPKFSFLFPVARINGHACR